MAQVGDVIGAVDVFDVNVIVIRPARGPGLCDLEVVTAIGEMRPSFDNLNMTDSEVVIATKMCAIVFVGDAATFFVPLGLGLFFAMFILGKSGERHGEQERGTKHGDCCESFQR